MTYIKPLADALAFEAGNAILAESDMLWQGDIPSIEGGEYDDF